MTTNQLIQAVAVCLQASIPLTIRSLPGAGRNAVLRKIAEALHLPLVAVSMDTLEIDSGTNPVAQALRQLGANESGILLIDAYPGRNLQLATRIAETLLLSKLRAALNIPNGIVPVFGIFSQEMKPTLLGHPHLQAILNTCFINWRMDSQTRLGMVEAGFQLPTLPILPQHWRQRWGDLKSSTPDTASSPVDIYSQQIRMSAHAACANDGISEEILGIIYGGLFAPRLTLINSALE